VLEDGEEGLLEVVAVSGEGCGGGEFLFVFGWFGGGGGWSFGLLFGFVFGGGGG